MNATQHFAWVSVLPTIVLFLFLVGALIYAAGRPRDGSGAKQYVILGLSILIVLRIVGAFAIPLLFQIVGPNSIPLYHGIYSLITSLIYMVAIGLLIAAAFTGRGSTGAGLEPGSERFPVASGNPYHPPSN